jgi:D-glycero-alpha-D-manno-heptose-7-phosphate kinase
MIVSKTPLRMSFVGGGSDLPAFYREEVGAVLSTSIDKYMYLCVNRKFDGRIRVNYSRTEEVDLPSQLEHPLVREALDIVGIQGGIEIASTADIPSKGSGLGSSSTYTVGLLNALYAYRNRYVSKETLAHLACDIEINRCGEPIGKQDQYAAAYGGLNLIRFHPDDSVSVDPVICRPDLLAEMEASTLVFFTGRTRSASAVLAHQSAGLHSSGGLPAVERRQLMRRMVQLAFELKQELESGTLENFGDLLDENWRLKSQMASGISDPQIDHWYTTGLAHGAKGGKLLGAGNGGFIMFFAPPERHEAIIQALGELQPVRFRFDRNGAQIVFYQPSE